MIPKNTNYTLRGDIFFKNYKTINKIYTTKIRRYLFKGNNKITVPEGPIV